MSAETSINIDAGEAIHWKDHSFKETEMQLVQSKSQLTYPKSAKLNRTEPEDNNPIHRINREALTFRTDDSQRRIRPGLNEIEACIVDIRETAVTCEIFTNEKTLLIDFQKSIFPEEISYGMSVYIGVDDSTGIRRPIIRERAPNLERLNQGKNEIAELMNKF